MPLEAEDPIVHLVAYLRETYSELCDVAPSTMWWYFTPRASAYVMPGQGWKLHVSATIAQAPAVLDVVAPLLIQRPTAWKVCHDLERLTGLYSVPSAISQVGKFITVYPRDDAESLDLALELHALTEGFEGPRVPSDRRLRANSLVSYRYGGFSSRTSYDIDSIRVPSIVGPDGSLVADIRQPGRWRPDWVDDPFPRHDEHDATGGGLFGRDFVVRGLLRQSAKGGVYAVTRGGAHFVLKEGRFGTNPDHLGRDARDRLANEFEVLTRLAPLGIAPRAFELFDAEDNRYLLMEHLPGRDLRTYLNELERQPPSAARGLQRVATSIVELVERCHAAGVVLRDLTPNNIIVARDSCKLVDLELAHLVDSDRAPFAGYTPGYARLEAPSDARATPADDRYSLGGCMFFMASGGDPYVGADQDVLPRVDAILGSVRKQAALEGVTASARAWLAPADNRRVLEPQPRLDGRIVRKQAAAAAEHVFESAAWESDDYLWPGTGGDILFPGAFQDGTTGIAAFLCETAEATGEQRFHEQARRVLDWTVRTHPFRADETPRGLYFGYAAIPWLLARIADSLDAPDARERAVDIALALTESPLEQLDITHGAAGVGLMALELFDRSGETRLLERAHTIAGRIAERAEREPSGTVVWSDKGKRMLGYAHGAAGLASYLLSVATRVGDAQLRSVAHEAFRGLVQATTPMRGGRGASWTKDVDGTELPWSHWCNGAAGVGGALLGAARVLGDAELEEAAVRAGETIRLGHIFRTSCQCHGLAGDGDFVLRLGREFHRPEMVRAARRIGARLLALRIDRPPAWTWLTEGWGEPAVGYMTGYTGIYSFLLRLTHPQVRQPLTLEVAR